MSDDLPDLTDALIDELFDVVWKFGRPVREAGLIFIAVTHPRVLYASMSAEAGKRRMVLMASHDGHLDGQAYVIPLDGGEENHLTWDSRLTVEDVRRFVFTVDAMLRTHGGINVEGVRHRVAFELSERLFARSVDVVFPSEHIALLPVPADSDRAAEVLRRQFDRPDDIAPFRDCFGNLFLCLAAWLPEAERRNFAMRRVCARRGITSNKAFEEMSPYQYRAYVRELERELANPPS